MSHIISKITFKVFAVIIAALVILGSYFSIVSYLETVENAENSEFRRLEGIVNTFSLYLEYDVIISQKSVFENNAIILKESVREQMSTALYLINASNNLTNGLSILVIDNETGEAEIIDQNGAKDAIYSSKLVKNIITSRPEKPTKIGIGADNYTNSVFYASPVDFRTGKNVSTYIFTIEFIGHDIDNARSVFYRQAIFSILTILLIGILGHFVLKRILKHEEKGTTELKEYIELAQKRNKELENLSFVLKKSDNLILFADKHGRIEWVNESIKEKNNYSGYELGSFIGKEIAEVSSYPSIVKVVESAIKTKEKVDYQAKSYTKNGKPFWASTTITPILDAKGEVEKLLFIDSDITRLKLAEEEISKLANFTQEQTRPLIRIQEDGLMLFANDASAPLLNEWGVKINDVIKKKLILETVKESINTNSEKFINLEFNNRIYNLRFFPVLDKKYVNIYGEDITETQNSERENRAKALELEQHNLNITDSINYARKIQEAILPGEDHIRQFFNDSFALSKPKDIVSGDFFWIYEQSPHTDYYIALADCTGHGVPGAMMSIIGHSLLNDIVETVEKADPARILEMLNKEIIKSLRQKTIETSTDGMDVSIIHIDLKNQNMTFAGAYQRLYVINGTLKIYKGDKQPIGGLQHDTNRVFTNHSISLTKGDSIYLASDGYQDQFGGPKNKKFLSRRLQELLINNHKYSMQAQSYIFKQTFEDWQGENEQIDDVSIIGIKF